MAYHHSLDGSIEFKKPISPSAAITLLHTLASYFNWTEAQLLDPAEACDQTVVLFQKDGQVLGIELHTEGEVIDAFPQVVEQFAAALMDIAKPDYLDLRSYRSGATESGSELIWYGLPSEVANAEREHHVRLALQHLQYGGAKPLQIVAVDTFIRRGLPDIQPGQGLHLGLRFWQELTTTFGCLDELTQDFGADTLANLFYLYAAINNNNYVEFNKNKSRVTEIIERLPSNSIWRGFIRFVD